MKKLLCLLPVAMICLALIAVSPSQSGYLLVKDVLSESGGHVESNSYLLDYSTGQVAVGQSIGSNHIESGGLWGWTPWCPFVPVEGGVSELLPDCYVLFQNYPNPFNPETRIGYKLAEAGHVSLVVFNVTGQVVCMLVNWDQSPGSHVVTWNGRDDTGQLVASGIYFYQLACGQFRQVRKMLLLK